MSFSLISFACLVVIGLGFEMVVVDIVSICSYGGEDNTYISIFVMVLSLF